MKQPPDPPAEGDPTGPAVPETGRVGRILADLGRISDPQIAEVLARQAAESRRFGELAIAMGLITRSDLDQALLRQHGAGREVVRELPLAPAPRLALDDASTEILVAVRAQLVHRWFGEEIEQRALAILSPNDGDGRSYVCAHLGRLFAELDEDTLLIDADLHRPALHEVFNLPNTVGLSSFLAGTVAQPPVRPVPGIPRLHLLPAGPPADYPHMLVARREFGRMLESLAPRYRAILIDTPALARGGDAMTIALRASGALLVVRRDHARVAEVRDLAQRLTESTVEVVGAVLNDAP